MNAAEVTSGEITFIHTGSMRLMSVFSEGRPLQIPPSGFGYPMAVQAVESDLPGIPTRIQGAFDQNQVVMSEKSARLRGAGIGDVLMLEGWDGEVLPFVIGAIVPDTEINWYEIVISSEQAQALGMSRPSSARIWNADMSKLRTLLDYMLPNQPIRVYRSGERISTSDSVLPTVLVKEVFGEFSFRPSAGRSVDVDQNWYRASIVTVEFPELGRFKCHRLVVPYLRSALNEITQAGLIGEISYRDFQMAGGCYNARLMAGGENGYILSRHSWGTAVDINPSTNRYGKPATLNPLVGEIMRKWGFAWGATWTVPDGMHFEWTHYPNADVGEFWSDAEIRTTDSGFEVYDRNGSSGSE